MGLLVIADCHVENKTEPQEAAIGVRSEVRLRTPLGKEVSLLDVMCCFLEWKSYVMHK